MPDVEYQPEPRNNTATTEPVSVASFPGGIEDRSRERVDSADRTERDLRSTSRDAVSWPVNEPEKQEWQDALKSGARDLPASEHLPAFPGSTIYRIAHADLRRAQSLALEAGRVDFRPGSLSSDEVKDLRARLSQVFNQGTDPFSPENRSERPTPAPERREVRDTASPERKPEAAKSVTVDYPGGKSRTFKADDKGNLVEFTQKDLRGEKTFFKDEKGQWVCRDEDGVEFQVKGEFKLDGKDFLYVKPGGYIRTEKPDGSIANERQLPDGSRLALDASGRNAAALVRPDNSRVEVTRNNGGVTKVVEKDKDGKALTWTRGENGVFTSDTQPPQQRKEMRLDTDGKYTYADDKGFTHVITGNGTERIEPKVSPNADGTYNVEIRYPGEKGARTLTLDAQGNLTRFTERDEDGTRTYFKNGSGQWFLKAGLKNVPVSGDFKLDKNGDFVSTDNGLYSIQGLDGKIINGKLNANGTRLRLDDNGNITQVHRKDGSAVEITWENGQKTKIVETDKSGAKTTWGKDRDGNWVSDGRPPDKRKSIEITKEGLVIGTDLKGLKHVTLGDGTRLTEGAGGSRFTFDDQGRITSVTYPSGSQWGKIQFQYDQSGAVNKWELFDKNGKLLETRTKQGDTDKWKVTDGNGKEKGTWTGDVKVSPQGDFMQRDPKDRQNDVWSYVTADFKAYHEKTNADGSKVRTFLNKSQIELDKDGRITRYTNGKFSRSFEYTNGELTKITDTTAAGTTSFNAKDYKNVAVDPKTGDYVYEKNDGSVVVAKASGSRIEMDKDGNLTRVTTDKGHTRTFEYKDAGGRKELAAVVDIRQSGDKVREERWEAQPNSDGTYRLTKTGQDGKQSVRENVEIGRDGSYKYRTNEGKEVFSRIERAGDGAPASVEEARERFLEAMREHFDDARVKRLEEMAKGFEERMRDRLEARKVAGLVSADKLDEWHEQTVAKTYQSLAEMVQDNGSATYFDQKTRARLAENFMFHAMDPSTQDQGYGNEPGHGTCWIQSAHIWGMTQHPGEMADLLKQVSLKGQYTTKNSGWPGDKMNPEPKTVTFSRNYLRFGPQESQWTIDNSMGERDESGRYFRRLDGERSPVGMIFDRVLPVIGNRPEGRVDGGTYESFHTTGWRWYTGCAEIMYMVTGDKPCDVAKGGYSAGHLINNNFNLTLLEKGTVLNYSPGHLKSIHIKKFNGEWYTIQDNQWGEHEDAMRSKITDLGRFAQGDRSAEQGVSGQVPRRRLPRLDGKDDPVGPGPSNNDNPWTTPEIRPRYDDPGEHPSPWCHPRPRRIIRWRRW